LSNPALRSCRTKRVDELLPEIKRVWKVNFCVYGACKVWHELRRHGHLVVARCTVKRLIACQSIQSVRRGKVIKTTVPADKALGLNPWHELKDLCHHLGQCVINVCKCLLA
jgi:putative transposase